MKVNNSVAFHFPDSGLGMCRELWCIDYSASALLPPTLPVSPMSGWLSVDNCITAYYLSNPRSWITAYQGVWFGKLKLVADFIPDFLSVLHNFLFFAVLHHSHNPSLYLSQHFMWNLSKILRVHLVRSSSLLLNYHHLCVLPRLLCTFVTV